MLILGTGREEVDLGPIHPQECETCQQEQPFCLRLLYRYEHLFFVFGNTRAKSYVIVCEVCDTAYRVPRNVAWKLGHLERNPIPFMRRYGCMMFFLWVLLLAAIGVLLGK